MNSSHPAFRTAGHALAVMGTLVGALAAPAPFLHAPSVNTYARHSPEDLTILSNGRYLKPEGRHWPLARWPHGLAQTRDGTALFVASDGVGQLVRGWTSAAPVVEEMNLSRGVNRRRSNTGAVDFSPDGKTLYWSSGESGGVRVIDTGTLRVVDEISLNEEFGGRRFADSFLNDLTVSEDGRYLYCADVANFRLAIVDLERKRTVGSVPVGRYPYPRWDSMPWPFSMRTRWL